MVSEKQKQEMRKVAASRGIREEFRLLRNLTLKHRPIDLDRYIRFLTAMSRLNSGRSRERTFVKYRQVKL